MLKPTRLLLLSLGGVLIGYAASFAIVALCNPYFPDPGIRDKEGDPAALIETHRYSDGDWMVLNTEASAEAIYFSPELDEIACKAAVLYGDNVSCTAHAYIEGEEVYSAELSATEEMSYFVFPYRYVYIDRIAFAFDEMPAGPSFDLAVATLEAVR